MQKFFLLFLFLFSLLVNAQQPVVKNLVFEGAGIKGIAYSGVIKELENRKLMDSIENIGGTSSGAITAMMLSIGYNADEIENLISQTKFQKFNDGKFFFIGGFHRMNKNFGWYRTKKFNLWLENIIYQKTGNQDITFNELSEKGYKNLYITATDLTLQKLVILSKETFPNMKIKDAVRISMSIPLYFEAAFVNNKGELLQNDTAYDTHVMVDGGILGNFPIFMFDTYQADSIGVVKRIPNPHTLGIRIDSDEQIISDKTNREIVPAKIEKFNDFMSAFYHIVIENLNRNNLSSDDWKRTISVSSKGISSRIKKLSADEKKLLIDSGQKSTQDFFNK